MSYPDSCEQCGGIEFVLIYDRELDCTVGYHCKQCGHEEPRSLAEMLVVADPTAFKES